uniref:Uncharacterized protein n=1 Tax=Rhizophora mucronata TaxID=61149 RepID=A0A2P2N6Z1_RHIMU
MSFYDDKLCENYLSDSPFEVAFFILFALCWSLFLWILLLLTSN